jgi:hypothetical protein
LLTTLAPLADLLLVWQLVGQWISYLQHGAEFQSNDLRTIGIYYCVFIVVDLGRRHRLFDGAARGLEPALVADAAALRLSPDHVLCRGALHLPPLCVARSSAGASWNATAPSTPGERERERQRGTRNTPSSLV